MIAIPRYKYLPILYDLRKTYFYENVTINKNKIFTNRPLLFYPFYTQISDFVFLSHRICF